MFRCIQQPLATVLLFLLAAGIMATLDSTAAWAQSRNPEPTSPATSRLTPEGIKPFLELVGYQPTEYPLTSGGKLCVIKESRKGWRVTWRVSLSRNEKVLWVTLRLTPVKDPAEIPQEALLGMLAKNYTLYRTRFVFNEAGKMIELARPMENEGITPRQMLDAFDEVFDVAIKTTKLWSPREWQKQASEGTPAPIKPTAKPTQPAKGTGT